MSENNSAKKLIAKFSVLSTSSSPNLITKRDQGENVAALLEKFAIMSKKEWLRQEDEKKVKHGGKVKNTSKEIDSKMIEKNLQLQLQRKLIRKDQVPGQKTIYVHPFSHDIQFDIYQDKKIIKTFTAFIETQDLTKGIYECVPKSSTTNIEFKRFPFSVNNEGSPDPSFMDLEAADVKIVLKHSDNLVSNQDAKCTMLPDCKSTRIQNPKIEFKCNTDSLGTFQRVLPPGKMTVSVASKNITTEYIIAEPLKIETRDQAKKTNYSKLTNNLNSEYAGSSLAEEGHVIVLGDASGSMAGQKFETLVNCMVRFVEQSHNVNQTISIALWGSKTVWFNEGEYVEQKDIERLKTFLRGQGPNLGGTELGQAFELVFEKFPKAPNILVMCDGEIHDIPDGNSFKPFRSLHMDTNFHFTGIGVNSHNMAHMAIIGNGNFEFSQ